MNNDSRRREQSVASAPVHELRYQPRSLGKSFKQWQLFIAKSAEGESAVYRTPHGDICSPARVNQLVTEQVRQATNRTALHISGVVPMEDGSVRYVCGDGHVRSLEQLVDHLTQQEAGDA